MLTLALDVDGVLLDPDRGGLGHWTSELDRRCGVSRSQLREAFFRSSWDDVVNGRRALEPALAEALTSIGTEVPVESVIACWFEADFVPIDRTIEFAAWAGEQGIHVALATNQEHRRAEYLTRRFGELFRLDTVVYSADLGVQKHDRAFFEAATERLPSVPADILFVDDIESNVERARESGWQAVHAKPDLAWIDEVEQRLRDALTQG